MNQIISSKVRRVIAACVFIVSLLPASAVQPVIAPDNGTGTIDWPVTTAPMTNGTRVRKGMQELKNLGQTVPIELVSLRNLAVTSRVPGGSLGGEVVTGTALAAVAYDDGATFNPTVDILMSFVGETGLANPPGGDSQIFETALLSLQGEIFGDPDFDFLRLEAGSDFGLPCPGSTTLRRLGPPGSDFTVDSFFDITYRIDFQGAPGGALDGQRGSSQHTGTLEQPLRSHGGTVYARADYEPFLPFDPNRVQIVPTPAGLVVSNIGSSGQDGVRFGTAGSDSDFLLWNAHKFSSIPRATQQGYGYVRLTHSMPSLANGLVLPNPGDELEWQYCLQTLGRNKDENSSCWVRVGQRHVNVGGVIEITPDWGELGATGTLIELYDNGQLVRVDVAPPGAVAMSIPAASYRIDESAMGEFRHEAKVMGRMGNHPNVTTFIGPAVAADSYRLSAVTPKPRITGVLSASILGKDAEDILVTDLELGMFGNSHRALGCAFLESSLSGQERLVVSNIGSSGQDGVSIDLGESGRPPVRLRVAPSDYSHGGGGSGGRIALCNRDSFGNLLGSAEYVGSPGGGAILVNFDPIGDPDVRVQVFNDGVFVGERNVQAGGTQVALVGQEALLTGCGKGGLLPPWQFPCFYMTFDHPIEIIPTAGLPFVGDEVRLLSVNSQPSAFSDLRFFDLLLAGVPGVEIYGEEIGGQPLPPVILPDNGSGTADWPPLTNLGDRREIISLDGLPPGVPPPGALLTDWEIVEFSSAGPGSLGGALYAGLMRLHCVGVGTLAPFERSLFVPIIFELGVGPNPFVGEDAQCFDTEILSLEGQLFGDPDFDVLRITAGAAVSPPGLGPSPGQVCLERLPGGDFTVDSFFDIAYQIEFQGAPGSSLAGFGGVDDFAHPIYIDRPDLTVNGLVHRPLGETELSSSGGTLTVSNIGSSGLDGVTIELPGIRGFRAELNPVALADPSGDRLIITSHGDIGIGNFTPIVHHAPLGHLEVEGGARLRFSYDFTPLPGVAGARLQVWDGSSLVLEAPAPPADQVFVDPTSPTGPPPLRFCGKLPGLGGPPCYFAGFRGQGRVTLPGQSPVTGTEIRFLAAGDIPPVRGVYEFELIVTDNSGLNSAVRIVEEEIHFGGTLHRGLGNILFEPTTNSSGSSGHLTISNIGSSGLDGVSIDLPDTNSGGFIRECVWEPIEFDARNVVLHVDHKQANGSSGLLSGIRNISNTGLPVVFCDPTALGSPDVRIRVYDDGDQLVLEFTAPSGDIGILEDAGGGGTSGSHWEKRFAVNGFGFAQAMTEYHFPFDGLYFNAPGHPSVPVRRLRLEPVAPLLPLPPLDHVDMRFENLPPLTLIREETHLTAHGLGHTSLGNATLDTDASGHLVVSNIGSSGEDGVVIDLGEAEGVRLTPLFPIDLFDATGFLTLGVRPKCRLPLCQTSEVTPMKVILSPVGGAGGGGRVHVETFEFRQEFGPVQSNRRVFGFDDTGNLVGDLLLPTVQLGDVVPVGAVIPKVCVFEFLPPEILDVSGVGPGFCLEFTDPVLFEPTDGSPSFQCSRLEFRCTDGTLPDLFDGCVQYRESDYQFVCRLMEEEGIFFSTEHLYIFGGYPARALGSANFDSSGGALTVSNIGSSGLDGVHIDLSSGGSGGEDQINENVTLNFQEIPFDFHTGPPAGTESSSLKLAQTAINGNSCGTAEIEFVEVGGGGSEGVAIHANFVSLGTLNVRVEVCRDGVCLGDFVVPRGEVARMRRAAIPEPNLVSAGGTSSVSGGVIPPGYFFCFDRAVEITPPGVGPGGGFIGDEVRVLAEGTLVIVLALQDIAVTPDGLPELTLLGIEQRSFSTWLQENYTGLEIAALIAANYDVDEDNDGGNVIQEFLVNGNPKVNDYNFRRPSTSLAIGGDGLPHLRHTFQLAPVSDVEIRLFRTGDLIVRDFDQSLFQFLSSTKLDNGNTEFTYELTPPVGDGGRIDDYVGHSSTVR